MIHTFRPRFRKQILVVVIACGYAVVLLQPPRLIAADPLTLATVAAGASLAATVVSLFVAPGPELTAPLLLQNRELIIELHKRFDTFGESLVDMASKIDGLREDIRRDVRQALGWQQKNRVIGLLEAIDENLRIMKTSGQRSSADVEHLWTSYIAERSTFFQHTGLISVELPRIYAHERRLLDMMTNISESEKAERQLAFLVAVDAALSAESQGSLAQRALHAAAEFSAAFEQIDHSKFKDWYCLAYTARGPQPQDNYIVSIHSAPEARDTTKLEHQLAALTISSRNDEKAIRAAQVLLVYEAAIRVLEAFRHGIGFPRTEPHPSSFFSVVQTAKKVIGDSELVSLPLRCMENLRLPNADCGPEITIAYLWRVHRHGHDWKQRTWKWEGSPGLYPPMETAWWNRPRYEQCVIGRTRGYILADRNRSKACFKRMRRLRALASAANDVNSFDDLAGWCYCEASRSWEGWQEPRFAPADYRYPHDYCQRLLQICGRYHSEHCEHIKPIP